MDVKYCKILPLSNITIKHCTLKEGIFRKPLNRLKILCMRYKSTYVDGDDMIDAMMQCDSN